MPFSLPTVWRMIDHHRAMEATLDAINIFSTPSDPRDVLPASAAKRFTALAQRSTDLYSAIPAGALIQDAGKILSEHQTRVDHLLRRRSDGGMGQDESSPSVQDERRKLERATAERNRLQELYDVRGARWTVVKRLEQDVANWVMRGGIPGGCVLDAVEDAPVDEMLKKGERLGEAVERYRHRLRELAADRHRVNSSPWPSSLAKQKAEAAIMALAERSRPNFDSMIEHNSPFSLPTMSLQSLVHGTETPAIGFTEVPDVVGYVFHLLRDQAIADAHAGIDEVADDANALDERQRAEMTAQITADELLIQRAECSLIFHAEAQGEIVDFREYTSPMALLGVRLVTAPRATSSSGSSRDHSIEVVHAGMRQ